MSYEEMMPSADKWLHADGSVTSMSGELILPPDPVRAAQYAGMSPQAAKWLLPDGRITQELPMVDTAVKRPTLYNAVCPTAAATVEKDLTGLPEGYAPLTGDILMVKFTGGTNSAAACKFTIAGSATLYNILFNGLATNTTASAWKSGGTFPFYFDGTAFQQLCYAKETDSNTTYTGFFDVNLASMKMKVNASRAIDRYQLVLERADGTFDKALTAAYGTGKTKAVNTATDFKVNGLMWFYNTTTALAVNTTVTAATTFLSQTYQAANFISYSLNGADNLAQYSWVYLVGIPQADPLVFRLDPTNVTSWYTTTKPATDNGKVYIRLGYFSDGTIFNLFADHPAYWFKDGAFRPYLTRGEGPHE